jgi:hypothetical protein
MFIWMVRWKVYGSVSTCGFSIDSKFNAVIISMDREIQVIYETIFFCWQFELEVFVYVICMV